MDEVGRRHNVSSGENMKTVPPVIISGLCPQPDYFDSGWF